MGSFMQGTVILIVALAGCCFPCNVNSEKALSFVSHSANEKRREVLHSIVGTKNMIDRNTGHLLENYRVQLTSERDIKDLVRSANDPGNIGDVIDCNLKLEHSDLSNVLDVTRKVPCTMTNIKERPFKTSLDAEGEIVACYPNRVTETWGVGDIRWAGASKRFDLVFSLRVECFESKEEAKDAIRIVKRQAAFCRGLSVEGNVIYNIQVQSDYYVSVSVEIVAYKSSGGNTMLIDANGF